VLTSVANHLDSPGLFDQHSPATTPLTGNADNWPVDAFVPASDPAPARHPQGMGRPREY